METRKDGLKAKEPEEEEEEEEGEAEWEERGGDRIEFEGLIKDGDEKGWFEGEGTRGGGGGRGGGGEAEWEERGGGRKEFEGLVRDEQEDGVKAKAQEEQRAKGGKEGLFKEGHQEERQRMRRIVERWTRARMV
ncbi:hypothetical protein M8J75_012978 [Diaphorina citri]|nr:hypothetical protein M8J75_012978 [Diaphorina citri]